MGFLLFNIALFLIFLLTLVNYWFVEEKTGYFRSTAKNLDIFANREFRAFWNKALIIENGYKFGREGETLSSALGRNELLGALTRRGKSLVWLLNKLDENHCLNAIDDKPSSQTMKPLNQPTPKKYTWLWKTGSFIYAVVILLNENHSIIRSLGLNQLMEERIRVAGVFVYFLFTYFNFNQTLKSNLKKA